MVDTSPPVDSLIGPEPTLEPPHGAIPETTLDTPPSAETEPPEPEGETPEAHGEPPELVEPLQVEPEAEAEAVLAKPPKDPDRPTTIKRSRLEALRQAEQDRIRLQAELDAERQARVAERAVEDARRADAQRALEGRREPEPWTPQAQRRPTQAELNTLWDEDPIMAGRVQSQMAQADAQAAQEQVHIAQLQNTVRADIDTFRRGHADYDDAVAYLEQREVARLTAMGIPSVHLNAMLQARAGLLVQAAINQGKRVPDLAYATAIADGWTVPGGDDASPAVKSSASPAEKVAASKARTKMVEGSLSNVPGSSASKASYSREDVMNMTEKEMDKLSATNPNWWDGVTP